MATHAPATKSPHTHEQNSSLEAVKAKAADCQACPLWKLGTQTVFGEEPERATIMLVGEQPGDQENLTVRPFVGPAGRLLDRALEGAGIDRAKVYVTNAVKHFKYEMRGKRRMHKSPGQREILACNRWLQSEIEIVRPQLIVAMGATAARAIFGRATAIQENRGRVQTTNFFSAPANVLMTVHPSFLMTVHPSFLLRIPPSDRESAFRQFITDLKAARAFTRR